MPVQYSSIVDEHRATRNGVGMFDVSHMGRFHVAGSGAVVLCERMLTRSTARLALNRIRYSLVCQHEGGILDDILVYRTEGEPEPGFLIVVNAGSREKIWQWFQIHAAEFDVRLYDQTFETAMIAVQGPAAAGVLAQLASVESGPERAVSDLGYYHCCRGKVAGASALISRTGYTGEDGFELIVDANDAVDVWSALMDDGEKYGAAPAGLGARDTLRLEAAMPLYGHELTEETNPFQAGLAFAVDLEGRDFVGHAALSGLQSDPRQQRRVGLLLDTRRVPREGYLVATPAGEKIGSITSGTYSPTLERPIAMAYLDPTYATVGRELEVDIRGTHVPARVVELPFYRRKKSST